jgi:hypothetical protein
MKIITAIASTTHIDRHNEKMTKSALDSMAEQACSKYIRFLIEHDPNKAIGVILAAKVLPMSDGELALVVVAGTWESEKEQGAYEYGAENTVWKQYMPILEELPVPLESNNNENFEREPSPKNLAELIESQLNSTAIWEDGTVIKIKRFVARAGDLEVHIYPNDHRPAHFHVISKQRGINARFDLNTFELINEKQGTISSKDQKKIKNLFEADPRAKSLLEREYSRFTNA